MSIDQPPAPMLKTGHQDSDKKQPASRGGWKIKQRRVPAKGEQEPRNAKDADRPDPSKRQVPDKVERKLIIGASPPEPPPTLKLQRSFSFSRPRLPLLLLLGVGVVAVVLTPFLGQLEQLFRNSSAFNSTHQASAIDGFSGTKKAVGAQNSNLQVRTIALPALENEGELSVYFRLPTPADWPIEVSYRTEAHTAEEEADFTPKNGIVTIEPGETLVELLIPLIDDDVVETAELFRVILSVDPASATMTDSQLTATVLDDDYKKQGDIE